MCRVEPGKGSCYTGKIVAFSVTDNVPSIGCVAPCCKHQAVTICTAIRQQLSAQPLAQHMTCKLRAVNVTVDVPSTTKPASGIMPPSCYSAITTTHFVPVTHGVLFTPRNGCNHMQGCNRGPENGGGVLPMDSDRQQWKRQQLCLHAGQPQERARHRRLRQAVRCGTSLHQQGTDG